jgi:isopropylmalate/homocitrate/citramalate synthase
MVVLPWEVEEIVQMVKSEFEIPINIHTHDDSGCGLPIHWLP